VDFRALNDVAQRLGLADVSGANTALEAVTIAGPALAGEIAVMAKAACEVQLRGVDVAVDIVVIDRAGHVLGQAG
jgi:cobalt-precorrin-5B (C1)-methyltransferase